MRYPPGWTNLGSLEDEPNSVAFFGIMDEETGESMGNLYITAERDSFEDGDILEALTERILTNFKSVPTLEDVEALEVTLAGWKRTGPTSPWRVVMVHSCRFGRWTTARPTFSRFIVVEDFYAGLEDTFQTVIDSFELVSP